MEVTGPLLSLLGLASQALPVLDRRERVDFSLPSRQSTKENKKKNNGTYFKRTKLLKKNIIITKKNN